MADVLGNEPRSWPRWLVPLALLAVVAGAVVVGNRSADPAPGAAAASPSASPLPLLSPPNPGTAGGACGGDITLPSIQLGPRPRRTGLRLLVGDRDLRTVDVDSGRSTVLRTVRPPITSLARLGGRTFALIDDRCRTDGYGAGVVVPLDPRTGAYGRGVSGDELLPGTPPTVIDYDSSGGSFLRELSTGVQTPIPPDWLPVARRGSEYVIYMQPSAAQNEAQGVGTVGTIGIGDPVTRRLTQTFGTGPGIIAAGADKVVWSAGGCDPGPCLLAVTGKDGIASAQPLYGRRPWSGVISPDGSQVAFRLSRTQGRLGRHPGPPNDIAVLSIGSGKLRVLPGLVLPAKGGLTLTWSPDSQWLVIGADLGTGPLVMIWRQGMGRPARVPIPATGGGTTGPPALLVLPG